MPVLATYFSVRRGRDPFFKFYMKTLFPRQVREYGEKYGIRFIGWYNVAHGWDFDNVILFELPDYATLDKLEADESIRALGHRAGEWIIERHHSMFLRERMGPELEIPRLIGETEAERWTRAATTCSARSRPTPPSSGPTSSSRRREQLDRFLDANQRRIDAARRPDADRRRPRLPRRSRRT